MHPPQDSLFPTPPWGRSRARDSGPRIRSGRTRPRPPGPGDWGRGRGVGQATSPRSSPPPSGFSLTHRPRPLPPSFSHCPSAGRRERVSRPDRGPVCISAWGSLAAGGLARCREPRSLIGGSRSDGECHQRTLVAPSPPCARLARLPSRLYPPLVEA